ncbi:hypothetical protein [Providencia rettgeri]|uniref:hypothetical protein n=1 Tax=Providencia rettgeri TaxID=587 RepID=UPI0034E088F8
MLLFNIFKNLFKPFFTLLTVNLLFGCSYFSKHIQNSHQYRLQGEIHSQTYIPEKSDITLSISSMDTPNSMANNHYNFHFQTKENSRHVSFAINLPHTIANTPQTLGVSVRVEKENKLVMMSHKFISIPKNLSEKMSIPITSLQ